VVVRLRYALPRRAPGTIVGIGVLSADGIPLFTTNTGDVAIEVPDAPGEYEAAITIPADVLLVGEYHVSVTIWDLAEMYEHQEPAVSFAVEHGPSVLYQHTGERKGFVHVPCTWHVRDRSLVSAE
jgi:hypothetical protein